MRQKPNFTALALLATLLAFTFYSVACVDEKTTRAPSQEIEQDKDRSIKPPDLTKSPQKQIPERAGDKTLPITPQRPSMDYGQHTSPDPDIHWHLNAQYGINIAPAWNITRGNNDVSIAIIDTGFLPTSQAFSGCSANYHYFDFVKKATHPQKHGGAVASLLSTCPQNPLGIIGISINSPVWWLELGHEVPGTSTLLLAWALGAFNCKDKTFINCDKPIGKPVDVINMSFETVAMEGDENEVASDTLRNSGIVNSLKRLWVASAGNESRNADAHFPSAATGVISVGATTKDGISADFSNWGETVEIMAPGQDVLAADENDQKRFMDGTSFSSPIIAGVVSLMKSVYPALTWKTAVYFLQSTAAPMDCDAYCVGRAQCIKDCCKGNVQVCTPGRVDAGAAVQAAFQAATAGLPEIALIDANRYIINLVSEYDPNIAVGHFSVSNLGAKPGRYVITTNNRNVVVSPREIVLPKSTAERFEITITVTSRKPGTGFTTIKIKSPESGKISTFSDEIMVYAWRK